jgi:hypothetical protein
VDISQQTLRNEGREDGPTSLELQVDAGDVKTMSRGFGV